MKLAIVVLLAFGAVTSARLLPNKISFKEGDIDKALLLKQKFLLDLLYKVQEHFFDEEGYKTLKMDRFDFEHTMYKEIDEDMELFYKYWMQGLIVSRGQFFSLFNRTMMKQTKGLFKLFYYAKDWKSFQKIALWARMNVNEEMFVYALSMAAMYREDMQQLKMPAYEEIFPQYFFKDKMIQETKSFDSDLWKKEMEHDKQQMEMRKDMKQEKNWSFMKNWGKSDADSKWWEMKWNMAEEYKIMRNGKTAKDSKCIEMMKDKKMFWLKADFSEEKLAYLLEDPAWNMYWHYLNMEYPFFMKAEELGLEKERRGERWVYNIQQLLARYFQERLSERMGKIGEFSWDKPIKMDFNSEMSLPNGLGFSMRKDYYNIYSTENSQMKQFVMDYERRMRDSFARGYYMMADGTKVEMCKPESFDIIGNLMQGNMDSIDRQFFGNWMVFAHLTASGATLDMYKSARQMLYLGPKIMLHMETAMRHPMFYEMYKHFLSSFDSCKFFMGPYKREEIAFKDIKIKTFAIDELKTFFSWSDSDISALMNSRYMYKDGKLDMDTMLFARRKRLDHKLFNIDIEAESEKDLSAVFRIFLGPKYDESGREMNLNTNRMNFIELDQFVYKLKPGMNMIKRSSDDFYWYRKDFTTYAELYKMTMLGLEGKMPIRDFARKIISKLHDKTDSDMEYEFDYEMSMSRMGAFPDRLMLPKGWTEGMPMKMFIMAAPADKEYSFEEQKMNYRSGFDARAFGFPLDRQIDEFKFWAPNMLMKDVMIFHTDEMM